MLSHEKRGQDDLRCFTASQHAKYVHPGFDDPAQTSETLPPPPPPHSPAQPHFLEPECTQDTA